MGHDMSSKKTMTMTKTKKKTITETFRKHNDLVTSRKPHIPRDLMLIGLKLHFWNWSSILMKISILCCLIWAIPLLERADIAFGKLQLQKLVQKISQSWDIERVPNHWLTDLFHQTERDGAFSWSGIWQFWENSKSPAVVLIDNDNYVAGDSDWDGLWFSAGSGGKQLKAEIISKTIKHQIAVRRSQSNRQIGGKRGNLTPNEMSTEIASHFSKYWKY